MTRTVTLTQPEHDELAAFYSALEVETARAKREHPDVSLVVIDRVARHRVIHDVALKYDPKREPFLTRHPVEAIIVHRLGLTEEEFERVLDLQVKIGTPE